MVLNSDIVLGNWSLAGDLRLCLPKLYSQRLAFGLSRREPTTCFPLLDSKEQLQRRFRASDWNTYHDICSNDYLSQRSRDALVFSAPVNESILAELQFPTNQLGSHSRVGWQGGSS